MKLKWYSLLTGSIFFILIDQGVKFLVRSSLINPVPILGSWFSLELGFNDGIALSIPLPINLIIGLSLVLILLIAFFAIYYLPFYYWPSKLGIYLFLGGALSNFFDRLLFGQVTDYIKIKYFSIFNFADIFIIAGLALIVIYSFKSPKS